MERVKLIKIEELETAEVPNNIEVGYEKEDYMIQEPMVGNTFYLYKSKLHPSWITSTVTEIIDKNTFKTLNSIYKIIREDEQC